MTRTKPHLLLATAAALLLLTGSVGRAAAQQVVTKVDLRKQQTPIVDQGGRGTCTSCAVVAALEAAYKRAGHDVRLSAEFSNHFAKMTFLDGPDGNQRTANQAESHSAALGGINTEHLLFALTHGLALPETSAMPYRVREFAVTGKPDWRNQFVVSSFNLNPHHLPLTALRAERYFSIKSFGWLGNATDPKALEGVLRKGNEVVWAFRVSGDRKGPVWKYTGPAGPKDGEHCVLLVGYDRTDPANPYFIMKNSWGPTNTPGADGYTYIAYNYLNYGTYAGYITAVMPPRPRPDFAFLGRWQAELPGHKGILDLYHVPGVMAPLFKVWQKHGAKVKVFQDRRLGTFYENGDLGRAYRVNGSIQGDKLVLTVNWKKANLPYDELGDYRVTLAAAKDNPHLLEGALAGPNGTTQGAATARRLLSPEAFENEPPSAEVLAELPEMAAR
jgi:hypothetical protein